MKMNNFNVDKKFIFYYLVFSLEIPTFAAAKTKCRHSFSNLY